ncbi:hypothetical protein ALC56_07321 [Trachymyrmex septentrionalis]|uniref:Uncharacterized protein n=1 Tax=Trachymyrmex septentrionalis TaxID=34720 RepID=A0A195FD21_9HYME|nr:hypothetical protein ALC56_07321 [Trachymyrmex septentrionalis]
MLIKAKERKTLVSPAKGVASQEMAGLSAPPTTTTPPSAAAVDIRRGERVPGFLSYGNCDGFTTYRLSVRRYPRWPMLGSRLLLGWLLATDLAIA